MTKEKKLKNPIEAPYKKKVQLLQGDGFWHTFPLEGYDLPAISMNDGPAGLRKELEGETPTFPDEVSKEPMVATYKATCFPSPALNACSFDPELMRRFGNALADECLRHNVNAILAPGVNIKRNPLGGRNFEYLSEDPYLSGKMASGFIKGAQEKGVASTIKHFVCNEQEYHRFTYTATVDERALREIYLKPFEIAIKESNPWMLMCCYNRINGAYGADNRYLLTDVLKREWHYDGVVVSDWGAVNDIVASHHNGLDVEMPCKEDKSRIKTLMHALKKKELDKADVDDTIDRLHLLSKRVNENKVVSSFDRRSNHDLTVEMASKSIVLAQNNKILPLKNLDDVCLIGALAEKPRFQAGGSSHVEMFESKTYLDIFSEGLEAPIAYEPGYPMRRATDGEKKALALDAVDLASTHKKVILFLGVPEGLESEGYDKDSIRLPEEQYDLFEKIHSINKNIIVVLCSGGPVELSSIEDASAILITYLCGEGGPEALKKIILGEVNPSGKLAESWPLHYIDVPSAAFYPGNDDFSLYKESIYVGYRYYLTAGKEVRFPFGYGLSYTNFEYSNPKTNVKELDIGKTLEVSFSVSNVGKLDGEEISQVYVSQINPTIYRPRRELKRFSKTLVKVGKSSKVKISLPYGSFAYYENDKKAWVVDDGDYLIEIGSSCEDIKLSIQIHVYSEYHAKSKRYDYPSFYSFGPKKPFSISDQEFEMLLGRQYVNDLPNRKKGKFTMNSTFRDLQEKWIGRLIANAYKKATDYDKKDPKEAEKDFDAFLNYPLRSGNMASVIKERYILSMIALANGNPIKSILSLMGVARRK